MKFIQINSIDEIKELLASFSNAFPGRIFDEKEIEILSDKFDKYAVVECLKNDGEIIAFSCFYCNDIEDYVAYISMIATSEKYRGKKYGRTMLEEVCRVSKERGMKTIRLEVLNTNRTAISFYEKNGFSFEKVAGDETQYMIKTL